MSEVEVKVGMEEERVMREEGGGREREEVSTWIELCSFLRRFRDSIEGRIGSGRTDDQLLDLEILHGVGGGGLGVGLEGKERKGGRGVSSKALFDDRFDLFQRRFLLPLLLLQHPALSHYLQHRP